MMDGDVLLLTTFLKWLWILKWHLLGTILALVSRFFKIILISIVYPKLSTEGTIDLVIKPGEFEIIVYETIGSPNSANMSNTVKLTG